MNQKIKEHLIKYNTENGYSIEEESLIETLTEANVIYEKETSGSRWWNNYFRVVEIDGMFIGYKWAHAFRDETAEECGWEFDSRTIGEVEARHTMTITYHYKPE